MLTLSYVTRLLLQFLCSKSLFFIAQIQNNYFNYQIIVLFKEVIIMMYLLLLAGFVLLIKGADLFVDGSSSVAGILKVPSVIIGLTIVAMGTSAPEAAVSIAAGFSGNSDISLGNIIGSNIFNLLIVIGVCAIIFPAPSNRDILKRDMWWNTAISALLFILIFDRKISRIDGAILLITFVVYIGLMIRSALRNRMEEQPQDLLPLSKSIVYIIIGLAAVVFGGDLVVDSAGKIAASLGMSDTLIGLTIVAIGTSLPELVTSITASKKGDSGIALGNAVGSCLFNIMFILGVTSVLTPINAVTELIIDGGILILVTILMMIFAFTGRKTNRIEGIICVAAYVAYTVYIIIR